MLVAGGPTTVKRADGGNRVANMVLHDGEHHRVCIAASEVDVSGRIYPRPRVLVDTGRFCPGLTLGQFSEVESATSEISCGADIASFAG